MKRFEGFEAKKAGGAREILPVGGYVCEIKSAKVEEYRGGEYSSLVLAIDVTEGKYAGFFRRDYDNNDREDRKWRGVYRISLPKDDGSEQDGWTKRIFGNFIWAVQESNPGYVWDWEEKKLKGKQLGVLFRNKEWEYNGRTGWTTEAAGAVSVDALRAGEFKLPKDKPLKNHPVTSSGFYAEPEEAEDGDLPF
ncbi:MAG: hypothetical protein IJQ02_11665 [Oscillospiraceae bacterium]|nr:hypothetical protein [Oscillospiraceae bacterium]